MELTAQQAQQAQRLLLLIAQVNRCMAGDLSMRDFENWLVPFSWNCQLWPDKQAAFVTEQIDGALMVSGVENWTDEELFDEWCRILANLPTWMTVGGAVSVTLPAPVTTGSTAAAFTWWAQA